jgi:hypothetical protein
MGKKPQHHGWPEAKKLCRLNQFDIAMAKRLGFQPDALIRAIPSPQQKWKLPVKDWVRDLHRERFGEVLGEKPEPPIPIENREEAARRFEQELYWGDYAERNADSIPSDTRGNTSPGRRSEPAGDDDRNVPF